MSAPATSEETQLEEDAKISDPATSEETKLELEDRIRGPPTLAEALVESRDTLLYTTVLQERNSSATRIQRARLESLKRQIDTERDDVFATNTTSWLEEIDFPPVDIGNRDSAERFITRLHQSMGNLMYVSHSCWYQCP